MAALRPWLLALFVIATLALTSLQGAIADQAPTESECRPYIEKALKQLETGDETPPDGDPGSSEESTVWNKVGEQGGTDDQQTHSAEDGEDSIEQGGAGAEGGASIEDGASSEEDGASAEGGASAEEGGASAEGGASDEEGGASEQGKASAESVEDSVSVEGESAQDAASVEEGAQDAASAEEGAESVEGSSEEKSGGESVEGGKGEEGESIEDGPSDEIGASVEEGKDSVEEGGASVEGDGSVEGGESIEDGSASVDGGASLEEGGDSGEEGGASSEEGRASVEEVGASVEKGSGSEEEGSGSVEEGGASVEEGGASVEEGGASVEEGGASVEEGGASIETGGHSAEEGSASVEDGGASLEEGGSSIEEGGASLESGSSVEGGKESVEEGGSSIEEGKDSVEEGKASLEEDGSSVEGKESVEEGGASLEGGSSVEEGKESVEEGSASVEEGTVSIEEGGASVEGGESVEEGEDSFEDKASVEEGSESVEEGGGSGEEGGTSIEDSGESVEEGGASVQEGASVEEGEESVEGAASVEEGSASIEGSASVESVEIVKEGGESVEEGGASVEEGSASIEEGGASVESVEDQIAPTTTEEAAGRVESTEQADPPGIQEETIISTEAPVEGEAAPEDSGETSAEDTVAPDPEAEPTPEEELTLGLEIPEILRPREHISQILRLDAESVERELLLSKTVESTLKELKRLYDSAIKPLEILYKYRDLSNRHFGDPEIFSKPLVLFMGPWSGGKSSIINYLLDNEYKTTSLRTGAEPSPAYFNILMWGDREEVLDGTSLAADWTFSGLQKFGQGLLDRLRGLRLPSRLLEKVNIVEIPGILEIRKQVERLFPFNDACQWFIDRADIIFLVYDPAKLDVGPETEAILDQLKGREYQTRIILNKADQVRPEELMRVQGTLIWNISPLMSSQEPPVMYSASLWSLPYEIGAPLRLLQAQERAFLRDLRTAVDRRVENKIASARRFAVRVRNHAKMVDCYLTTYYNHKSFFGSRQKVSDDIVDRPQDYHIYEGLSTLTNISRYDLPDPDVYRDFFRLNPLYDFQQLSSTCTYFRGCPINRLDVAIAYDLPELVGKYRKSVDETLASVLAATQPKS